MATFTLQELADATDAAQVYLASLINLRLKLDLSNVDQAAFNTKAQAALASALAGKLDVSLKATDAEAGAGVDDSKWMTAAKVAYAISILAPGGGGGGGYDTPAAVLAALLTVDGAGSNLDADKLDGQSASFFLNASNLNAGSVPLDRLADALITYAKLQNVSATDKLLGRSTVGAGVIEEITCTAFGRAVIAAASYAAMRTTLGLVIGTDVQGFHTNLEALASGGVPAAGKIFEWTGTNVGHFIDTPTGGGGGGVDYEGYHAHIQDKKAQGVAGQAITGAAWRVRELNYEVYDPLGLVTISSNQLVFNTAGTYEIEAVGTLLIAVSSALGRHRLWDATAASVIAWGINMRLNASTTVESAVRGRITVTTPKAVEFQSYTQTNSITGGAVNSAGEEERYSDVFITKLA